MSGDGGLPPGSGPAPAAILSRAEIFSRSSRESGGFSVSESVGTRNRPSGAVARGDIGTGTGRAGDNARHPVERSERGSEVELVIEFPPSRDAQEKIYAELSRMVDRISICRSWPVERRQDLVHDAWIKVIEDVKKKGTSRRFNRSFFRTVAYRTAATVLYRESRQVPDSDKVDERVEAGQLPALTLADPNPELQTCWNEDRAKFMECLNRLCTTQRRIILLVCLEGHSIREAAMILEWSYLKADRCLYNARKHLRHGLRGKDWTNERTLRR